MACHSITGSTAAFHSGEMTLPTLNRRLRSRSLSQQAGVGLELVIASTPARIRLRLDLVDAVIQIEGGSPHRRSRISNVRAHDANTASRTQPVLAPREVAPVEIVRRGTLCGTES
jgi:hypothetical protein